MGISNTSRTLKYIRDRGWKADIVERWIKMPKHPAGGFRKDLLGIIDIIGLGEKAVIGIQSTGQGFSSHNKTIIDNPMSLLWLECGGRLMLIGWRKKNKSKTDKRKTWQPRIKEYARGDFE